MASAYGYGYGLGSNASVMVKLTSAARLEMAVAAVVMFSFTLYRCANKNTLEPMGRAAQVTATAVASGDRPSAHATPKN